MQRWPTVIFHNPAQFEQQGGFIQGATLRQSPVRGTILPILEHQLERRLPGQRHVGGLFTLYRHNS